jgi:hypothetical protein
MSSAEMPPEQVILLLDLEQRGRHGDVRKGFAEG